MHSWSSWLPLLKFLPFSFASSGRVWTRRTRARRDGALHSHSAFALLPAVPVGWVRLQNMNVTLVCLFHTLNRFFPPPMEKLLFYSDRFQPETPFKPSYNHLLRCRAAAQTCRRRPRRLPGPVQSSPSSGTTLWLWWFCARSRTT